MMLSDERGRKKYYGLMLCLLVIFAVCTACNGSGGVPTEIADSTVTAASTETIPETAAPIENVAPTPIPPPVSDDPIIQQAREIPPDDLLSQLTWGIGGAGATLSPCQFYESVEEIPEGGSVDQNDVLGWYGLDEESVFLNDQETGTIDPALIHTLTFPSFPLLCFSKPELADFAYLVDPQGNRTAARITTPTVFVLEPGQPIEPHSDLGIIVSQETVLIEYTNIEVVELRGVAAGLTLEALLQAGVWQIIFDDGAQSYTVNVEIPSAPNPMGVASDDSVVVLGFDSGERIIGAFFTCAELDSDTGEIIRSAFLEARELQANERGGLMVDDLPSDCGIFVGENRHYAMQGNTVFEGVEDLGYTDGGELLYDVFWVQGYRP